MIDDATITAKNSGSILLQLTLSVALIVTIGGLVYIASQRHQGEPTLQANAVVTGQLQVSYMLITSKTESTEEASGSTIDASRVQYFPGYVLVTTKNDATMLWSIDRLKKFEVTRIEAAASSQNK